MGFKVFFEKGAVKLGDLFEALKKLGEIIYVNGEVFVWLKEGKDGASLRRCLKKVGLKDFFLREITEETIEQEKDFAYAWGREHLNEIRIKKLEEDKQDELKQMMENIQKASQLFDERVREYIKLKNKEGVADGREKEQESRGNQQ